MISTLSSLLGRTRPPVASLAQLVNVSDTRAEGTAASSGVSFENDGDLIRIDSNGNIDLGEWITPASAAGNAYESRATLNTGGPLTTGTTGTWEALDTTRSWTCEAIAIGECTANVTFEIRLAATGVVQATKTIDITATII